jgi:hypothetical protein
MLLMAKEDPSHKISATIVRSLGMLQSTTTRNFAIIVKKKGTTLKIVECDFKIDML